MTDVLRCGEPGPVGRTGAGARGVPATTALDRFAADPAFLSHVVRFDQPRLGDVRGLRGVHLQCHIGTDTVSLSPARGGDVRAWTSPGRR